MSPATRSRFTFILDGDHTERTSLLIISLLVTAVTGTYLASRFTPVVIAAFVALFFALSAAMWVNDQTFISDAIVGSWRFLSGVDTPDAIVGDCPAGTHTNGWILLGLAIGLANLFFGLAALIAVPAGCVASIGGSIYTAITRKREGVEFGLGLLAFGLGAVVVAGLVMRALNAVTTGLACS
jgi:hypothetical protein